jgi:hypothetical protein
MKIHKSQIDKTIYKLYTYSLPNITKHLFSYKVNKGSLDKIFINLYTLKIGHVIMEKVRG